MTSLAATLRAVMSAAAAALLVYGCNSPEAFHETDAGVVLPSTGTGGFGQAGGAGGIVGSGGMRATGGVVGTGGSPANGGNFGGAGAGSGGGGGMSATGGHAPGGSGGAAGGGGGTASGGAASGGMVGSGGIAGMAGGPVSASGGTGGGGTGGGAAGSSGGGHGGTGAAGSAGSAGSGGVVGTNPCAGLCTKPIVFTTKMYTSGNLGTAATCHETTASITSGNCSNFTTRTFKVNDTTVSTSGGNWPSLPAKRNGGYCFQASAGTPDFASFVAF